MNLIVRDQFSILQKLMDDEKLSDSHQTLKVEVDSEWIILARKLCSVQPVRFLGGCL